VCIPRRVLTSRGVGSVRGPAAAVCRSLRYYWPSGSFVSDVALNVVRSVFANSCGACRKLRLFVFVLAIV
jgi:hypothetical protein